MNHAGFAGSDVEVSRIGFGAMGLGGSFGAIDEPDAIRNLLHVWERGINFVDTARVYGRSEHIIGAALKQWSGPPPFIATKALSAEALGWGTSVPVDRAYPEGAITRSVTESLQALLIEQLDLLQLHQYWPIWDRSDYWMEELLRLKERGLVRFIGLSLPDHRHDLATAIIQSGHIDSIQTIVNIFDPLAFDSLVPLCQAHDVSVIARCILDEGGLTGFLSERTTFEDDDFRQSFFAARHRGEYLARLEALRRYVPETVGSLTELAIRYVLSHPGVTTAVTSMHVPAYAEENIAFAALPPLSQEVFEEIRRNHRWIRNFYEGHYWPA